MAFSMLDSRTCRVTLEYEDGMILSGVALATDLSINEMCQERYTFTDNTPLITSGYRVWELTLKGIDGLPTIEMSREKYREQVIEPARTASEWKCDRCGAVWPRQTNKCGACGFWRPFIYE